MADKRFNSVAEAMEDTEKRIKDECKNAPFVEQKEATADYGYLAQLIHEACDYMAMDPGSSNADTTKEVRMRCSAIREALERDQGYIRIGEMQKIVDLFKKESAHATFENVWGSDIVRAARTVAQALGQIR